MSLPKKAAIVTGGANGIGYAIVKALATAGASILIADIAENGEEKAKQLRELGHDVFFIQTNVTKEKEIEQAVGQAVYLWGRVDILINNAGIYPRAMLTETTEELWDQVLAVNLKSIFLCCKVIVPIMTKNGGGNIINISSTHADIGLPELFAYAVSKGGGLTLTRNLAGALAPQKIRVNAINPGWVATEKEIAERARHGQDLQYMQNLGKQIPLGRMQTEEDTSALALFLVSEQASQITGQLFHVDGGKNSSMAFNDSSLDPDS